MADAINDKCKEQNLGQVIWVFVDDLERYIETEFKVNDKVICCRNLYEQNVMNGSVGKINKRYKPYRELECTINGKQIFVKSFGTIIWDDGIERNITIDVVDALKLAYAITIHKSQGSQFERVIVPIEPTSNLDRTMLYTAVTRATTQNIIIGSKSTLKAFVSLDLSEHRKVHLKEKFTNTYS
jgi:exodeoxyribonuclease V alpha subunit